MRFFINRRFGGTYHHLQGRKNNADGENCRWLLTPRQVPGTYYFSELQVSSVAACPFSRHRVPYDFLLYQPSTLFLVRLTSSTLKMEATRSSETSIYNKPTRRHIPQDGTLHSHLRENLLSYNFDNCSAFSGRDGHICAQCRRGLSAGNHSSIPNRNRSVSTLHSSHQLDTAGSFSRGKATGALF
jgi:hypothetical protein